MAAVNLFSQNAPPLCRLGEGFGGMCVCVCVCVCGGGGGGGGGGGVQHSIICKSV